MSTTNGNGLLDELLEAMKQDDDPKRLTQKQADRLCKRVAEIAEIQTKKVKDAAKEVLASITGYVEEKRYYGDSVGQICSNVLAADYVKNGGAPVVRKALLVYFDKEAKKDGFETINLNLKTLMPKAELKKRKAFALRQRAGIEVRRDAGIASIEADKNNIIDATIFYKSEQVIDILAKFEDKEYFS